MTDQTNIDMAACYSIHPTFLFRWEASQDAHVLLYPEGIVKLNETGGRILAHCDGDTTVTAMIDALATCYDAKRDAVAEGVVKFLEVAHAKGWIRAEPRR
ncbi:pyrroloquinoline quinone biosynthesis peptide chaperone PqqD [Billgrantia antri]|uniref:Pyrroloquinoline quinone biosynthesis peptide chaperone PqqD n=1 Tax=Halomonas sulfidivorans TaxID=2733488 RepID=A0ABX7WNG5_9GAMM|nr:pyrroloquinoline quinone biosynthesis peptide chaperone PqqD [Halomonas sulfidivorans]QTP60179.1 pyrroloquinoline quinone biosynthesis peptide chaperone PqqD [Halomonas sulfidivorans]